MKADSLNKWFTLGANLGVFAGLVLVAYEINQSGTQLELDVGWLAVAGVDPVTYMRRHEHRVISCHLKDFDRQAEHSASTSSLPCK